MARRQRMGTKVWTVVAIIGLAAASHATVDLSGDWEGAIHTPGGVLNIVLTFTQEESEWTGVIDIPQQGTQDLALSPVTVRGDSVLFALPGIPGNPRFSGVLAADGATLAGDFTQGGANLTFSTQRVDAQTEAAELESKLEELRAFIDTVLVSWEVPGLAIGIVKDGEAVLAEGFGQRNVEEDLPVTANTLFAIGSTTKAMTCMAIGMLVDEGLVDWDDLVRAFLPSFTLEDPVLTNRMLVRDLVTHRSGLPRHDWLWYGSPLSREELFDRLRYLEASRDLRETFQYNNLMYMAAGYLVGQVTGGTWEEFMARRLFEPLGMTGSNFSVTTSQETEDHSLPHGERDGEVVAIPFRNIDAIGPAGSVNSSASDMAKWLKFNLDGGKVGDRQLISPSSLRDMHSSHMAMPSQPNPNDISYASYGLGWMVESYRGHYRLEHGGGIDGFVTSVSLLPHDGLGIVVMANHGGTPLPDIVARQATDLLLGLEPVDWHGQRKQGAAMGDNDTEAAPIPGTRPGHDLADYVGEYIHPGYGTVEIDLEDGELTGTFNSFAVSLEHFHYETFAASGPEMGGELITFYTDPSGEVAWLSMSLEPAVGDIEFDHLPVVRKYVVLRAAGPISVDGKLNDSAWKRAPYTEDFVTSSTGAPTERRTRARMVWTDTHWYLAWTVDDADIQGEMTDRDDGVWQEDSVELFIDPDGNGRNYVQVVVNPLGTVLDVVMNRQLDTGGFGDDAWDLEGLEVAVTVDGTVGDSANKDKRWVCEIAIPFAALEFAAPSMAFPPASADEWRVNLCRTDHDLRSDEDKVTYTTWSRTDERGYHVTERFGRITFSDEVAE